MVKRLLAVGDIHGMYDKLMDLWAKVKFNPDEDIVVFLGGYIDRGPDGIEVLKFVKDLKEKYPKDVFPLKGNHEWLMETYLLNGEYSWLDPANGGKETYDKLQSMNMDEAKSLVEFAENLECDIEFQDEENNYKFVHAGYLLDTDGNIVEDSPEIVKLWVREEFYKSYTGKDLVIVDHTPVQCISNADMPIKYNNILFTDTGSFMENGKITCVNVFSGEYFQS